ncbi:MAG: cysteine hydrolase family protein [Acidimicrobiales bacterium]
MVNLEELVRAPQRTALLVIDMQNDFLLPGAPVEVPGGLDLVPHVRDLGAACRHAGYPVVYTQEMHLPDLTDFGVELHFEPPHCLEGGGGEDLVDGLGVAPGDVVITRKRRYDAFFGTELETVLRLREVENLLVAGVCTDVCVLSTVLHARHLDYRCCVLSDAVAGTTPQRHDAALECLAVAFAHVAPAAATLPAFGLAMERAAGA